MDKTIQVSDFISPNMLHYYYYYLRFLFSWPLFRRSLRKKQKWLKNERRQLDPDFRLTLEAAEK